MSILDQFQNEGGRILRNNLGTYEGVELGSQEARDILEDYCWLYVRPLGRIWRLDGNHDYIRYLFWLAYTGGEYVSCSKDGFLKAHMGFHLSSVSHEDQVYIDSDMVLTAQEKIAFRRFRFVRV